MQNILLFKMKGEDNSICALYANHLKLVFGDYHFYILFYASGSTTIKPDEGIVSHKSLPSSA